MFWTQSTTKDYVRAENKLYPSYSAHKSKTRVMGKKWWLHACSEKDWSWQYVQSGLLQFFSFVLLHSKKKILKMFKSIQIVMLALHKSLVLFPNTVLIDILLPSSHPWQRGGTCLYMDCSRIGFCSSNTAAMQRQPRTRTRRRTSPSPGDSPSWRARTRAAVKTSLLMNVSVAGG